MHKSQQKLQRNINTTYNHISVTKQALIIIFFLLFFFSFFSFFGTPAGVLLAGRRPAAKFGCRPPALKPEQKPRDKVPAHLGQGDLSDISAETKPLVLTCVFTGAAGVWSLLTPA